MGFVFGFVLGFVIVIDHLRRVFYTRTMNHTTLNLKTVEQWQHIARRIGGKFAEGYLFGLREYMKGIPPLDQYENRRTIWAAGYRLGIRGRSPV